MPQLWDFNKDEGKHWQKQTGKQNLPKKPQMCTRLSVHSVHLCVISSRHFPSAGLCSARQTVWESACEREKARNTQIPNIQNYTTNMTKTVGLDMLWLVWVTMDPARRGHKARTVNAVTRCEKHWLIDQTSAAITWSNRCHRPLTSLCFMFVPSSLKVHFSLHFDFDSFLFQSFCCCCSAQDHCPVV